MIRIDLHNHTCYSHGQNTVLEMANRALDLRFGVFGFSEHSPRPNGYVYPVDYQEKLNAGFESYIDDVTRLKKDPSVLNNYEFAKSVDAPLTRFLLGLEVDWIGAEREYVKKIIDSHNFDYLIGSVHFLGKWGFDASADDWNKLSRDEIYSYFSEYFKEEIAMAETGWMQIAAHPDLIKIFKVDTFHDWLMDESSKKLIKDFLTALKDMNMAMEISSAGIIKPCHEIYPCSYILRMAANIDIPITFASDAHSVKQVGLNANPIEFAARDCLFKKQRYFVDKQPVDVKF